MTKRWLKCFANGVITSLIILSLSGCNQSPIRNPFAGKQEPKLGELPAISANASFVPASLAWSNNALSKQERFTKLRPFVDTQTIYAADQSGKIVALDRHSGQKKWSVSTRKKFSAGPILMGDKLFLTTKDAKVVALMASNGEPAWEAKVSSEVLGSPSVQSGSVLVYSIDGAVTALNASDGSENWHMMQSTPALTLHFSSTPIIVNHLVLVGFSTGKLVAFNLNNGLIEWERVISLPRGRSELQRMVDISADPIVIGDKVYVITYQGKLAAVNITSGDLVWEREISSYQNIAYDHKHLYITDNEYHLWAIDRHSGTTLWKQSALASRYISAPAVQENRVIVGDREGYLHFVDAENGQLVSRLHLSGKLYQGPIVKGRDIFVSMQNGKMALINRIDGRA